MAAENNNKSEDGKKMISAEAETGIKFSELKDEYAKINNNKLKIVKFGISTDSTVRETKDIKHIFWLNNNDQPIAKADCLLIGKTVVEGSKTTFQCGYELTSDSKIRDLFSQLSPETKSKIKNGVIELENKEGIMLIIRKIIVLGKFEMDIIIQGGYWFGCYNVIYPKIKVLASE